MTVQNRADCAKAFRIGKNLDRDMSYGRTPRLNTMIDALDCVTQKTASPRLASLCVRAIVKHGPPHLVLQAHDHGLMGEDEWEAWKGRMRPADAKIVLSSKEAWPQHIREWAAVVEISAR